MPRYLNMLAKTITLMPLAGLAQKSDTTVRYLDEHLQFTGINTAAYTAKVYPAGGAYGMHAYYPNGNVLFQAHYADKRLRIQDGAFTYFYPVGTVQVSGSLRQNQKEGIWRWWYPNGVLKDSGRMANDAFVGAWHSWYPNGQMKSKAFYIQESTTIQEEGTGRPVAVVSPYMDGVYQSWYEDGQPEAEGSFAKGRSSGNWKWYHRTGHQSTEEVYNQEGKLTSMFCYDSLGRKTGDFCSISKPALLKGIGDFKEYLYARLAWPEEALRKKIEGTVTVTFKVTTEGKMVSLKVRGTHEVLAHAVHKFIKELPDWEPAISHNRVVEWQEAVEIPFNRKQKSTETSQNLSQQPTQGWDF